MDNCQQEKKEEGQTKNIKKLERMQQRKIKPKPHK